MKILFVADIHVNLRHKKVPKDFAINRTRLLWKELHRIYEEYDCDLEVHGGDMWDKLPNLEELQIYYDYVHEARDRRIVAFPGNHEATSKYKTFVDDLKSTLEYINPNYEMITDIKVDYPVPGFDILPYNHLHKFKMTDFKGSQRRALFTHVRGEIPPHVKPEVDLEVFNNWDVVFAGDLHSKTNSQRNIVYPGSPLSVSFHRNPVKTGVIIIDTETLGHKWVECKVPQLYKKTVTDPEDIVQDDFHLVLYDIEGDSLHLKEIKDETLVDKKIVTRESPAKLDLTNLTVSEELIKYLSEIVGLESKDIQRVLDTYEKFNPEGIEVE